MTRHANSDLEECLENSKDDINVTWKTDEKIEKISQNNIAELDDFDSWLVFPSRGL